MKKALAPTIFVILLAGSLLFDGCYSENINDLSTFTFQFPVPFHSVHWKRAAPDTSYDFTNLYEYKEYRDNEDRVKKAEILHFNYWIDDLIYVNLEDNTDTLAFAIDDDTKERVSYKIKNLDTMALIHAEDENANIKVENYYELDGNGLPVRSDHTIVFDFIRFYLIFARWAGDPGIPIEERKTYTDERFWEMRDEEYLLGEFTNVDVENAFRFPDRNPNQQDGDLQHHIEWVPDETARIISTALKETPQFYIRTEYSKVQGQNIDEQPKYYFPWVSARYDLVIRFEVEL